MSATLHSVTNIGIFLQRTFFVSCNFYKGIVFLGNESCIYSLYISNVLVCLCNISKTKAAKIAFYKLQESPKLKK